MLKTRGKDSSDKSKDTKLTAKRNAYALSNSNENERIRSDGQDSGPITYGIVSQIPLPATLVE